MKQKTLLKLGLGAAGRYGIATFLSLLFIYCMVLMWDTFAMQIVLLVLMVVMSCGVLFEYFWSQGEKDAGYISRGLLPKDIYRGLKAGLIALFPWVVFWLVLLLNRLGVLPGDYMLLYKILNAPHYMALQMMVPVTMEIADVPWSSIFLSLLFLIYVPLSAHIGYILGLKRISLKQKLMYKK